MLDYVVDRHGNEIIYRYSRTSNGTGLAGSASTTVSYHRAIELNRIEYGTRAGVAGSAPARVDFVLSDRCFSASCGIHDVWNWPDTPWDLQCDVAPCSNNMSPTFFTSRRVSKIVARVRVTWGRGFPARRTA
jgi:hypothetical protein